MLPFPFNPPLWRSFVPVPCVTRSKPRVVCRFLNIFAGFCGALAASGAVAQSADPGAALPGMSTTPAITPSVDQAARTYITRSALEAPIRFLSADALEGRGPGTRGDQLARLYLATELEGLGYQPAFPDGQWQQPLDIVGIRAEMPRTWSFQAPQGRVDLKWRDDYIAVSGQQSDKVSVDDAELV